MNTTAIKRTILAGATMTFLGLGAVGAANAATNDTASTGTSLIDKIATTFHVDRSQVAALFAADRQEHEAQMQADQAARLAQAVTDGKLTQAQADHITNAQKEIQSLRDKSEPGQETAAQRTEMKAKMDALRSWATTNNVDEQYIGGGHGGPDGGSPDGAALANKSSGSTTTN